MMRFVLGLSVVVVGFAAPKVARAELTEAAKREAFQRATDGDIAIAEAEAAEKAGNVAEARKLFRYALTMNPEDSEVWYQSALFEVRQKNQATALKQLDEAVKRDPENLPAAFDRAVLLDEMGRKDDATSAFAAYSTAAPNDTRPHYYLGTAALAKGDRKLASDAFAAGRKGDDELGAKADCQYAILSNEAGEDNGPELAKAALQRAPTDECRTKLTEYASQASSRETGPWLNGRGIVGLDFDTNASLVAASVANSATVPASAKPIAGFRLVADLRLVFRPVAKEVFTAELEAGFINATHLNNRRRLTLSDPSDPTSTRIDRGLGQFDYGGPSGTARIVSRFGSNVKFELSTDFVARNMWLNAYKRNFLLSLGAYPAAGVIFWPGHVLYALAAFEYRDFHDPVPAGDPFERDSFTFSVGLLYQIPVWIFDGVVTGGFDQDNTKGKEFFLRGGHGTVGIRAHVLENLSLYAFVSGNLRVYERATPRRFEQRWEYGGSVRWDVIKHLALSLQYSYMTNDSKDITSQPNQGIDGYTYRRHLVNFGVEGYF